MHHWKEFLGMQTRGCLSGLGLFRTGTKAGSTERAQERPSPQKEETAGGTPGHAGQARHVGRLGLRPDRAACRRLTLPDTPSDQRHPTLPHHQPGTKRKTLSGQRRPPRVFGVGFHIRYPI